MIAMCLMAALTQRLSEEPTIVEMFRLNQYDEQQPHDVSDYQDCESSNDNDDNNCVLYM